MKTKKLRVCTSFSGGFGSIEFALKYLNIPHEVVFACEWMKPQRESYILNHGEPTSNFYEDIRTLDGTKYKGEIDYYHLSPPCQSYSLAGSRGGASDDRGGLMFEAIKSIDEVQPKMFTVENVKGLLSSNGGEDWKNIIRDFKSLKGYTISWGVMNAKEQGTPQNRERVFIVGFRGQSSQFSFPQRQDLKVFLYDLLEDDVNDKYFLSEKMVQCFQGRGKISKGYEFKPQDGTRHANCLSVKYGNYSTDTYIKINSNTKNGYETAKLHDGISLSRPTSTTRRGRVDKQVAQTLDTSSSQGVLVEKNIDNPLKGKTEYGWHFEQKVYSENSKCTRALTSSSGSGSREKLLTKDFTIRKLTPRECARIQGDFKDMFKFGKSSDTKLYEFIGNAMDINTTKNLIEKMLVHLKNIELSEPSEPSFNIGTEEKQNTNLLDLMGVA